jgi:N-acetylmuramoyl-L-alanine amidase
MRIVLDSPNRPDIAIALDNSQQKLMIDLKGTLKIPAPGGTGIIKKVLVENISPTYSRAIFELIQPIKITQKFFLSPSKEARHYRYVIDITHTDSPRLKSPLMASLDPAPSTKLPPAPLHKTVPPLAKKEAYKTLVIDAGHGGPDPGALGCHGTQEKDITLAAAKELKQILEQDSNYRVVLTRERDIFLPLGERVKKGRTSRGDLFISLHADSHPNKATKGLSIYTLSKIASDKEAARLAAKENKADLFIGIDLEAETPEVANILIDLTKRETMNLSADFAHKLKKSFAGKVELLHNTHRFANFAVLRTPDIPAVLIELGYISNQENEKKLKSPAYLRKIALGILEAVHTFYQEHHQ